VVGDGALRFSPLAIPFMVFGLGLAVVAAMVVLTRGNALIRAAALAVVASAAPYSIALSVIACTDDPDLAHRMAKLFVGSIGLLGPSLMLLLLALSGRHERHRGLLAVATLITATTATLTWFTDLMIRPGMWRTASGMMFHRAAPFDSLHVGQFVGWAIVGAWLSRRGTRTSERHARQLRRILAMLALAVLGASDALLANGIGVYPFGVVPGTAAVAVVIYAIRKHDLLRGRGVDRRGAWELVVIGALVVGLGVTLWLAGPATTLEAAVLAAPLLAIAQLGVVLLRRGGGGGRLAAGDAEHALDTYVDLCGRIRREHDLEAPLDALLVGHAGVASPRLLICDDDGRLRTLEGATAGRVDARIRPWLLTAGGTVVVDDLPTMRLGGLREPVEAFVTGLGVDLIVPLSARDQLVGLLVSELPASGRSPRDDQLQLMAEAAGATARALVYASLQREVETRLSVAREVEVAAAVQQARSAGEQRHSWSGCDVVGWYQPAEQFGGHWWAADPLPDGRFAVVLGDVAGSSVSAALVSFTAEGAYETARRMLGIGFEVISVLETLHASLGSVGGERHAMSCLASVFDPDERRITFANAGHPFPYLVRRNGAGVTLRALVSRGTPLGGGDLTLSAAAADLVAGDQVLLHSDSLTEVRDPAGQIYGHRRLQRLLRARAGDPELVAAVIDDIRAHAAGRLIDDDLSVIMVRIG